MSISPFSHQYMLTDPNTKQTASNIDSPPVGPHRSCSATPPHPPRVAVRRYTMMMSMATMNPRSRHVNFETLFWLTSEQPERMRLYRSPLGVTREGVFRCEECLLPTSTRRFAFLAMSCATSRRRCQPGSDKDGQAPNEARRMIASPGPVELQTEMLLRSRRRHRQTTHWM
jgi:hypothetical protein